jgi:hypothetical protein
MSAGQAKPITAPHAEDEAAAMLLIEVEDYLLAGQPRQAIAHIVEMTGVESLLAEQFVEELKPILFARAAA